MYGLKIGTYFKKHIMWSVLQISRRYTHAAEVANVALSSVTLWDCCCVCGLLLIKASLCGAYLFWYSIVGPQKEALLFPQRICSLIFFFRRKMCLLNWKAELQRKRERQKTIFHLLPHSPDGSSGQFWHRRKLGTPPRDPVWVQGPSTWTIFCYFSQLH